MEKKLVSFVMLTLLLADMLMFAFNIQPVRASGTIYIRPDGSVEGTDKIRRNGDIYTFTSNIHDSIVIEKDNIVVDGAGYTLEGTGVGIKLLGRSNIRIKNAEIKEFLFGIELRESSNIIIQGNNITNNGIGISLSNSNDNHIYENNITSQNFGITLSVLCSRNSIFGNCIADNYQLGIGLMSSSYNSISGNSIKNNTCGIELISAVSGPYMPPSSYNSISGNNVTANYVAGIRLQASPNNSMVRNTIEGNGVGIRCSGSSNNSASGNNVANNSAGMQFLHCWDNSVSENTIRDNNFGISISMNSSNNRFYRNNFVSNTVQVQFLFSDYANVWDDGYPSGGNYWSDHVTVDDYSGVNQDEPGSDGIVDEPYIINACNRDNYPLAQPWSPTISAIVDIDPDTLNLESEGGWITAYVELPETYDVYDIDVSSVMLNDTVPAELGPTAIGDFDNDMTPDLMVKFDRATVESFILDHINLREAVRVGFTTVTLTITGELTNGTQFQGSDTIKIVCTPPQKL